MHQVLLVGGTFDPIHNEHLRLAELAIQFFALDEAWFLIAKTPRWKRGVTKSKHRLEMLEISLKSYANFRVCKLELESSHRHVTYTIDTIKQLHNLHPETKFYFLIGSDQLRELHRWKDIDELCNLIQFILVHRPNYPFHKENYESYHVIDSHIFGREVSITNIRLGILHDVPNEVQQYILRNGIYLDQIMKNTLPRKRYLHSKSVAKLAVKLARSNKMNVSQAYIAGILHDCAKNLTIDDQRALMERHFPHYLSYSPHVYHQFIGSYLAKEKYHIIDEVILNAISSHATASTSMDKLAKLLYCADKIDPSRDYDSSRLIDICKRDIEAGFCLVLRENLHYLRSKNIPVEPITQLALTTICIKEDSIE